MPRERLSSYETSKLLNQGRMKFLDASNEMGHSEIVYEIVGAENSSLTCDFCGKGARFVQHTRDHQGQNFIALTCEACAPGGYERLVEKRNGG